MHKKIMKLHQASPLILVTVLFGTAVRTMVPSYTPIPLTKYDITLLQNASIGLSNIVPRFVPCLMLTSPNISNVAGRALYFQPIRLRDATTNAVLSFSTNFTFSVQKDADAGGEGLAFVIVPDSTTTGEAGGYLGWLDGLTNNNVFGHSFAVEFDTFQDLNFNDMNDNHVGVNVNSLNSTASQVAGIWEDDNDPLILIDMSNEYTLQAWIEYNGVLDVTISTNNTKPAKPLISESLDLTSVLNEFMYVGFTAATGNYNSIGFQVVSLWTFDTGEEVVTAPRNPSPAPSNPPVPGGPTGPSNPTVKSSRQRLSKIVIPVSVSVFLLWLLSLLFAALCYSRFLRKRSEGRRTASQLTELNSLPDHYGSHRITYKDLSDATGKFSEKRKLEKGGFGWVYKGVLPGSKVEVAVKRMICKSSKQGAREFLAEVNIIGRMRHRNLVPLLGWCHHKSKGELLLVYEYMSKGSLDHLIFRKNGASPVAAAVLPWEQRMKILIGIATALHFLHEEYEQRVLHRDVKASNVLLDGDFNARLGDFGLARLHDHGQGPQTTMMLAGTPGYMAPELFQGCSATEKTDVYSFGALALEVATGYQAAHKLPEDKTLVNWVWSHFATGNILAAADSSLGRDYDEKEMELVLLTGLLSSHPGADQRPTMRQSLSYVKMEAPFPMHMLPRPLPSSCGINPGDKLLSRKIGITEPQETTCQERI